MPATIYDVAKRANVGIGTVSSVINNSRPVNEETRQRVLKAIAELDFVPNFSGRRLSLGKTHMIGVVLPYFSTPSQVERLHGAMSVLAESEFDVSLFTIETSSQRKKILKTVPHRGRIDGLIVFSIELTEQDIDYIAQKDVPTVLVEAYHPALPSIYLDDTSAARNAVAYLIGLGHQRIAFISDFLQDDVCSHFSRNRYNGYCQALTAAGLPVDPDYHQQGPVSLESGQFMAHKLLSLPTPPTAIFVFSDLQALGVLEAARVEGVNVPKDLSVVGYDDILWAHFARLTTVNQQLYASGVEGGKLLLKALQDPDMPPSSLELSTELVIRQTTAPPGS
ncbi:MAG TPA: LacI family DNA-binding transcriptional regulator [Anaerolineae bacterium]|nr:LacI family DNA-binding transcriptional regulator [Anaerolineae bacterium]HMR62528.1 LacI family DNA-binding transcriptional regulator [Anaerolineae bacterium]